MDSWDKILGYLLNQGNNTMLSMSIVEGTMAAGECGGHADELPRFLFIDGLVTQLSACSLKLSAH